jgi:hypothetical protein
LRPGADGNLQLQFSVIFDEIPPVTTIAWRLTHIIDLLAEERCGTWIGLSPEPENLFAKGAPPTAEEARAMLVAARERWIRYVSATNPRSLLEKIGPIGRQFANDSRMKFILHIIDELIHHAAEVGVLRDLYRAQQPGDQTKALLLSGDRSAVDGLGTDGIEKAKRDHPQLVLSAAETAQWAAIPYLIELGFGVDGREGRTPLHHVAAGGQLDLVQLLVDGGVDVSSRDPNYHATASQWAMFFGQADVLNLLTSLGG